MLAPALVCLFATANATSTPAMVVHTGGDRAVDAATLIAEQLALPVMGPSLTIACAHDVLCASRPKSALVVVSLTTTGDEAGAGWRVHLELVDAQGVTTAVEDVTVSDWSVLRPSLAPALGRIAEARARPPGATAAAPVTSAPATSTSPAPGGDMRQYEVSAEAPDVPARAGMTDADIWQAAGGIAGACCVLGAGGLAAALVVQGGDAALGPVSDACGNVGNVPACLCALPQLGVDACVASIDLLTTFIACLDTLNECASCGVPSQALVNGLSTAPTEGGPPFPSSAAETPTESTMRF